MFNKFSFSPLLLNIVSGYSHRLVDQDIESWTKLTSIDIGMIKTSDEPYVCSSRRTLNRNFIFCYQDTFPGILEWGKQTSGQINFLKIMNVDDNNSLDVLTIDSLGFISSYEVESGDINWQSNVPLLSNVYSGFKDVVLLYNQLIILIEGRLIILDSRTGAVLNTVNDSGLTAIDQYNETRGAFGESLFEIHRILVNSQSEKLIYR